MLEKSDSFLVDSLREGSENAYMVVIEKYGQKLYAYLVSLSGNKVVSQDLLQNVFLKLWEYKEKLQVDSSLKNYLYKTAYHEFINHYKRNHTRKLIEEKYHEALEKIIQEQDESRTEQVAYLLPLEIEKLSPRCQQVFMLSREEGLTNKEIARHLDISVKNVEAQITKAFKSIKEGLSEKYKMLLFLITK
ncbi:MAG: RNA polymerase sigma-70 factor [Cytophagaceae bacterium]|nr:RNA polymerase sigma-70 factor [Cytophagaceae bacterium]|tara:strand:+ start:37053 stop:37622 length:570 start_codon:yes stop_codon:yes gene_type:complete